MHNSFLNILNSQAPKPSDKLYVGFLEVQRMISLNGITLEWSYKKTVFVVATVTALGSTAAALTIPHSPGAMITVDTVALALGVLVAIAWKKESTQSKAESYRNPLNDERQFAAYQLELQERITAGLEKLTKETQKEETNMNKKEREKLEAAREIVSQLEYPESYATLYAEAQVDINRILGSDEIEMEPIQQ